MAAKDPWEVLGGYIRSQRQIAQLSLRELAARTNVSNAYLSQIERGLHEPSVRVITSIADALQLSAEALLSQAGVLDRSGAASADNDVDTEAAIRADKRLTDAQKQALLAVYRSYVKENE